LQELSEYRVITGDGIYAQKAYDNEEEMEKLVVQHAKEVFGEDALYFDVKQKVTSRLRSRITDGVLLDFRTRSQPRFWIVEYELRSHDIEGNVIPQLRGFTKAIRNEETIASVRDFVYNEIRSDPQKLGKFKKLAGEGAEIHYLVNKALHEGPGLLVIFDRLDQQIANAIDESDLVDPPTLMEFVTFQNNDKLAHLVNPLVSNEMVRTRMGGVSTARVGVGVERKWGRGTLNQILQVVSVMKEGKDYSEACRVVASKLSVRNQTVRDKSTRRIGLSKAEFVRSFEDGTLMSLLAKRYPNATEEIQSAFQK
jgi:predicted small metal-binding protein